MTGGSIDDDDTAFDLEEEQYEEEIRLWLR